MAAAAAREQKARRLLRTGGAEQRTKRKNAIKDEPCVFIDRNTAFGVQLAQRDLERPLLGAELAEDKPVAPTVYNGAVAGPAAPPAPQAAARLGSGGGIGGGVFGGVAGGALMKSE